MPPCIPLESLIPLLERPPDAKTLESDPNYFPALIFLEKALGLNVALPRTPPASALPADALLWRSLRILVTNASFSYLISLLTCIFYLKFWGRI